MFNNHLASDKHKRALTLRQNTLTMLKKGNIKAQITTAATNSAIETRKRNQREEFLKSVLVPYILWLKISGQ